MKSLCSAKLSGDFLIMALSLRGEGGVQSSTCGDKTLLSWTLAVAAAELEQLNFFQTKILHTWTAANF